MTRKHADDPPGIPGWTPEQCLDITQALAAYIRSPQEIAGLRQEAGQLAPGFNADLVVLPFDPFIIDPQALLGLRPAATMLGGEWVWKSESNP